MLSCWNQQFLKHGPEVFECDGAQDEYTQRIFELERMVRHLTMEREISKTPCCC